MEYWYFNLITRLHCMNFASKLLTRVAWFFLTFRIFLRIRIKLSIISQIKAIFTSRRSLAWKISKLRDLIPHYFLNFLDFKPPIKCSANVYKDICSKIVFTADSSDRRHWTLIIYSGHPLTVQYMIQRQPVVMDTRAGRWKWITGSISRCLLYSQSIVDAF